MAIPDTTQNSKLASRPVHQAPPPLDERFSDAAIPTGNGPLHTELTVSQAAEDLASLNAFYGEFLSHGFLVLKQAIHAGDMEWVTAEIELLHNVPSLLNEPNIERHRYFWHAERQTYLNWLTYAGKEFPLSRMQIYYQPLWSEVEPIMVRIVGNAV